MSDPKFIDLDDEFEEFMRKAYPDVPGISSQYRESRRIFISGALILWVEFKRLADFTADEAMERIGDVDRQFAEFAERVARGKD